MKKLLAVFILLSTFAYGVQNVQSKIIPISVSVTIEKAMELKAPLVTQYGDVKEITLPGNKKVTVATEDVSVERKTLNGKNILVVLDKRKDKNQFIDIDIEI